MATMKRLRVCLIGLAALGLGVVATQPGSAQKADGKAQAMPADDANTWKSFMTDKILQDMLTAELDTINTSMRSPGTFFRGYRKVEVSGRMIAILGNIGTLIFEGEEAKKAAALRAAGNELAEACKKKVFNDAKKAAETIKDYPSKIKPAETAEPVKFKDLISLDDVMKGVSRADTDTGNAIKKIGASFDKESRTMAAQSYLLACLGVAARVHNDAEDWQGWCDEMRAGSIKMAEQFARKNQAAAKEARAELQKSCVECHEVYREEL